MTLTKTPIIKSQYNNLRTLNLNLTAMTIPVRRVRIIRMTTRIIRAMRITTTMRRPARMIRRPIIPTMTRNLQAARATPAMRNLPTVIVLRTRIIRNLLARRATLMMRNLPATRVIPTVMIAMAKISMMIYQLLLLYYLSYHYLSCLHNSYFLLL
jgi:hypothetical protein